MGDDAERTSDAVLETERAVNERYKQSMLQMQRQLGRWAPKGSRDAIVGRVALTSDDRDLGTSFYVGSWARQLGEIHVVSFAAPIAGVFYRGSDADHEVAKALAARRTFYVENFDLKSYDDDVEPGVCEGDVFPFKDQTTPSVERPSRLPTRPSGTALGRVDGPARHPADAVHVPTDPTPDPPPSNGPGPGSPPRRSLGTADVARPVRAVNVVRRALAEPRTGALHALLATLQPDQYEMIAVDHTQPTFIQGGPGTGKTVIGLHRAAFLTHPEGEQRLTSVLVLGPSDRYVEHVKPVLDELGCESKVKVLSVSGLLGKIGFFSARLGPLRDDPSDRHADDLQRVVRQAARAFPRQGFTRPFVKSILGRGALPKEALVDVHLEVVEFLAKGLDWASCEADSRYHPLLAIAAVAIGAPKPFHFDHIIVDEVQDVRLPIWPVLNAVLRSPTSLTMIGDMDQRRTDFTPRTWDELAGQLGFIGRGEEAQVLALENAFRSTAEILHFAGRLLPPSRRRLAGLRHGPEPTILKVAPELLSDRTINAIRIAASRLRGVSAIITVEPRRFSQAFAARGWRRIPGIQDSWTDGAAKLVLLHPDAARGLEFDAVAVVEPLSFPKHGGRYGQLYTALTRATKELYVVHTKPLPKELTRR